MKKIEVPTQKQLYVVAGRTNLPLATEIAEEYGVDPLEVSKQVRDLLKQLDAMGLIQDASMSGTRQVTSSSEASEGEEGRMAEGSAPGVF